MFTPGFYLNRVPGERKVKQTVQIGYCFLNKYFTSVQNKYFKWVQSLEVTCHFQKQSTGRKENFKIATRLDTVLQLKQVLYVFKAWMLPVNFTKQSTGRKEKGKKNCQIATRLFSNPGNYLSNSTESKNNWQQWVKIFHSFKQKLDQVSTAFQLFSSWKRPVKTKESRKPVQVQIVQNSVYKQ